MRIFAFCVLLALAFTTADDSFQEDYFFKDLESNLRTEEAEMTQATHAKGTSPFAGTYEVYYQGRKRSTDMTIDCNSQVTQKNIFSDRLHFTNVKAKCGTARDAKATMYILKTHGPTKYECVHMSGTNIKGSHYVGPNVFWGTIEYKLKKKTVCGITKKAEACQTAYGQNFRGKPGNEDVKRVERVTRLADCSALCSLNALCTYFVYQKGLKRCWLKKNFTHKQADATCESGFKCVTKAKAATATVKGTTSATNAYVPTVKATTIKKDVKGLEKKFFSKKQTLQRKNSVRSTIAHLEGGIDDEEDKPLTHLSKNSRGKNRIYGTYSSSMSKLNKNGQVRGPGYTPQDASTGPFGHYYLGPSRRRIGTGFGRRRRSYVARSYASAKASAKAKAKAAKNVVKTAVKSELKQKAKAKGVPAKLAASKQGFVGKGICYGYNQHGVRGYKASAGSSRTSNGSVNTLEKCQAYCRSVGGCNYVSWGRSNGFGHKHCIIFKQCPNPQTYQTAHDKRVGNPVYARYKSYKANTKAAKAAAAKAKAKKAAKALVSHELKAKHWLHGGVYKGQIKATHGKCLDASQRNRTGGKVHMWNCNTSNKNQHWTYTKATGQIKATHGKCLDASQRNKTGGKVHMWNCNTSNKNQHWTYNKATGQIKATHGKCLDASQRNKTGGKVHMWNCNTSNKNQHWSFTTKQTKVIAQQFDTLFPETMFVQSAYPMDDSP